MPYLYLHTRLSILKQVTCAANRVSEQMMKMKRPKLLLSIISCAMNSNTKADVRSRSLL